jgi:hypothetical protein
MLPQYIISTYKNYQDCLNDKPSTLCAVTAYSLSRAISLAQDEKSFDEEFEEVFLIRRQKKIEPIDG